MATCRLIIGGDGSPRNPSATIEINGNFEVDLKLLMRHIPRAKDDVRVLLFVTKRVLDTVLPDSNRDDLCQALLHIHALNDLLKKTNINKPDLLKVGTATFIRGIAQVIIHNALCLCNDADVYVRRDDIETCVNDLVKYM